jgi:hypothetical protein
MLVVKLSVITTALCMVIAAVLLTVHSSVFLELVLAQTTKLTGSNIKSLIVGLIFLASVA